MPEPKTQEVSDLVVWSSFVDGVSNTKKTKIQSIIYNGLKNGTDPGEICSLVVISHEGTCTKVDKEICLPKPKPGRLALLINSVYNGEEKSFFWTKKNAKVQQNGMVSLKVIKNDCIPLKLSAFSQALQAQVILGTSPV